MPGLLLFVTSTFFLEGLKRPLPGLVAMALANLVNVALALLLVPGGYGIVAMGAVGAAWVTTIARTLLGLGMVAYVWWMRDAERFGVRTPAKRAPRAGRMQAKLGVTSALSGAIEDAGFTILNLFAGWLGAMAVGAFAIGISFVSMVFMAALGIGTATAVRVGFARGRGDRLGAARAGWLGLGLNTLVMGVAGLAFVAAPDAFVAIFTEDAALAAMVAPVLWIVALMLTVDGGQSVMANALRGLGDTWVPTVLHTISYLGVMAPLGWALAFPGRLGIGGLFLAMLLASVLSVALVSARFRMLSRRL
jgi:MATE family multidrug resistance protein